LARKIVTQLLDDIDGGEAAESITFSVDGVAYEIDLSEENATQLREDFAKWISHARRISSPGGRSSSKTPPRKPRGELDSIRSWARANGYEVGDRGRIPNSVQEAYAAAH